MPQAKGPQDPNGANSPTTLNGNDGQSVIDYHCLTLDELQSVFQTGSKSNLDTLQRAWQTFADNLLTKISSRVDGAASLDKAVDCLGSWNGPAAQPFREHLNQVRAWGLQLAAAASEQSGAAGVSPGSAPFDNLTGGISDSIRRMHDAGKALTSAVSTCFDQMRSYIQNQGNYYTQPPPDVQVWWSDPTYGPGGTPTYEFWYRSTSPDLLDPITFFARYEGDANRWVVWTAFQFASGVNKPGTSCQVNGNTVQQLKPMPATFDASWGENFNDPVLWHQLALLLNYTVPTAYQQPSGMFPQPPVPPAPPGDPKTNKGGGGGGTPGPFGGVGFPGGKFGGLPGGGAFGGPGSGGGVPFPPPGGRGGNLRLPAPGPGVPTHLAGLPGPRLPGSGLATPGAGAGLPMPGGPLSGLSSAAGPGTALGTAGGGPGSAPGAAGLGPAGAAALNGEGALARMPMMPPMMPPGTGANGDGQRKRQSWLPEDEDVWGAGEDGVPPVISGDS